MASRAERRRAAAVLFLFAVLHRSTALDHAAADARARKLRAGGAVGHTAGGERASPAQTPSRPAQGNAFDSLKMVFELAVVETETTVPRGGGRVSSAGKRGCFRDAQLLLPGLLRDGNQRAGGT